MQASCIHSQFSTKNLKLDIFILTFIVNIFKRKNINAQTLFLFKNIMSCKIAVFNKYIKLLYT